MWIYKGTFDQGYQINVQCPNCYEIVSGPVWKYRFCPYCGKYNGFPEEAKEQDTYYDDNDF